MRDSIVGFDLRLTRLSKRLACSLTSGCSFNSIG